MRQINLLAITIENFKSFREPTTVQFNDTPGLKFLTGKNEVEPRLGANGAGKTSLWDALFWCLYGTSALGDKIGTLIPLGTDTRPYASVILSVNNDAVAIEREGSPERITFIDATEHTITQNEINVFLGMNKARFAQSVLFAQKATFFLDLSIPARGQLLDDALDLAVWMRAADEAKAERAKWDDNLKEHRESLLFMQGQLTSLDTKELEAENEHYLAGIDSRIAAKIKDIESWEVEVKKLRRQLKFQATVPDTAELRKRVDELELQKITLKDQLSQRIGQWEAFTEQMQVFFEGPDLCPTCEQEITGELIKAKQHEYDMTKIDYQIDLDALRDRLAKLDKELAVVGQEVDAINATVNKVNNEIATKRFDLTNYERDIEYATREVEALFEQREHNPWQERITKQREQRKQIEQTTKELEKLIDETTAFALLADYWKDGFKQIRLFVIRRMLAMLELETANAASMLGIGAWKIHFTTETETKSGTLKQGVQIRIIAPNSKQAAIYSGGEGQRFRLAVEMGLAQTLQRLAGVNYNFEVWDEPSTSLSDEGIEDLLDALRYRAQTLHKCVWLVDHRTYSYVFDETLMVRKTENGSIIDQ